MFAYIDPGAGTLLLQAVIASLIGVVVFFRSAIWRLTAWFRSPTPAPAAAPVPPPPAETPVQGPDRAAV